MAKFAKIMKKFHESKRSVLLLSEFQEMAKQDRETKNPEIITSWDIMKFLIQETEESLELVPGKFYLDMNIDLRSKLTNRSLYFLEKQFRDLIERQIQDLSRSGKIKLGTDPSTLNLIKWFIQIRLRKNDQWQPNLEIVGNVPIWALIYFAFRCGVTNPKQRKPKEIEDLLLEVEKLNSDLKKPIKDFIRDYRSMNRENLHFRSEDLRDPYKKAIFNLIGGEKSGPLSDVFSTVQDWMWLQLCWIKDAHLKKFQEQIEKYGPTYFNKNGKNPLLYFMLCLLSHQFEEALRYILQLEDYRIDGLHFGLTLYYYGLLPYPRPESRARPGLDLIEDLLDYAVTFALEEPETALYYIEIIHEDHIVSESPTNRVVDLALKRLLLETRHFAFLLGEAKKLGKISEFFGNKRSQDIARVAAEECDRLGRFEDAIKLYSYAGEFEKLISLLVERLSQGITRKNFVAENKDLAALAMKTRSLGEFAMIQDRELVYTFDKLLTLMFFFDEYYAGHFEDSLRGIESAEILPLNREMIHKSFELFQNLSRHVKRNFAEILLAAMDTIYRLYVKQKNAAHSDLGRTERMEKLKERAKVLVMFSGMISLRLPGDLNSKLVRMATQMES